MQFKSKNGETMIWVSSLKKIISFNNGVVDVDDNVGKELVKLGYIENSKTENKQSKVEAGVKPIAPAETKVVASIKPIRPKKVEIEDDAINSEI